MGSGEISRGEKMALRGTDPESYISEYTLLNEHNDAISANVDGAGTE